MHLVIHPIESSSLTKFVVFSSSSNLCLIELKSSWVNFTFRTIPSSVTVLILLTQNFWLNFGLIYPFSSKTIACTILSARYDMYASSNCSELSTPHLFKIRERVTNRTSVKRKAKYTKISRNIVALEVPVHCSSIGTSMKHCLMRCACCGYLMLFYYQ